MYTESLWYIHTPYHRQLFLNLSNFYLQITVILQKMCVMVVKLRSYTKTSNSDKDLYVRVSLLNLKRNKIPNSIHSY